MEEEGGDPTLMEESEDGPPVWGGGVNALTVKVSR